MKVHVHTAHLQGFSEECVIRVNNWISLVGRPGMVCIGTLCGMEDGATDVCDTIGL